MDMGKKKIKNVDDNKMISMGCHAGLTFWECSWTLTFFGKSAAEFEYATNFTDISSVRLFIHLYNYVMRYILKYKMSP